MAKKKTKKSKKKNLPPWLKKDGGDGEEDKDVNKESANIAQFLKSLSEKNYAEANKYLQASMEDKMKARIKGATGI